MKGACQSITSGRPPSRARSPGGGVRGDRRSVGRSPATPARLAPAPGTRAPRLRHRRPRSADVDTGQAWHRRSLGNASYRRPCHRRRPEPLAPETAEPSNRSHQTPRLRRRRCPSPACRGEVHQHHARHGEVSAQGRETLRSRCCRLPARGPTTRKTIGPRPLTIGSAPAAHGPGRSGRQHPASYAVAVAAGLRSSPPPSAWGRSRVAARTDTHGQRRRVHPVVRRVVRHARLAAAA